MKKVVSKEDNIRIDKYLSDNTEFSREFVQKLISKDLVKVNGNKTKASYKVNINDEIEIFEEELLIENNIEPTKMDLNIVYEDEDIMVINKPSGLVVHPGSGNYNNTLVNGLMYYTKNLSDIGGDARPGIVHRIDKDTSGLLLVAKNDKVHAILADGFKNKTIKRVYVALLKGNFPNANATIDAPIGRDKTDRKKMCVTGENSKDAITHLKVIKRYDKYTLVELRLETGRTHQIRVHMKYIGYPVYNDPVYTKDLCSEFGQFLHAKSLEFEHPITKEHMYFESELPIEFKRFIDNLEEK